MEFLDHVQQEIESNLRSIKGILRVGRSPGGHSTVWGKSGRFLGSVRTHPDTVFIRIRKLDHGEYPSIEDWEAISIYLGDPNFMNAILDVFKAVSK